MPIRAIETKYKGYRFRSRLEARWAIYFDSLNIVWEYEHEGVSLPSGNYLPDFWLSTVSMWAEVKPKLFTQKEHALIQELAIYSGNAALMLVGTPEIKSYAACMPDNGQEVEFYLLNWRREGRFYSSYGEDLVSPDIERGVEAARGARFEHGEMGGRVW